MLQEWKRTEWLKIVFEGCPGGRRKTGRPRKRWLDDTEEDRLKRWRNKTTEREIWAKSYGRPMPYMDCSTKD
jgi:hypothetical protein